MAPGDDREEPQKVPPSLSEIGEKLLSALTTLQARYENWVMEHETEINAILVAVTSVQARIEDWIREHETEIKAASEWFEKNRPAIEAFSLWSSVVEACDETNLYAPISPEAWTEIGDAQKRGDDREALSSLILRLYGPDGVGHGVLETELREAELLQARCRQVEELLDSFHEERFYVVVCGALPLVEGLLAETHGKWQKSLAKYPLDKRLFEAGALTKDEETDLLLNHSAVKMVLSAPQTLWKSGGRAPGSFEERLNRHRVAHGITVGWETQENATRALLLLAAAARVAGPLLKPREV